MALTSDQNQSIVLSGLRELIELLGRNKVASDADYAVVRGKDYTDFETMSRGWLAVVLQVSDDEATANRVKAGRTSYFEG